MEQEEDRDPSLESSFDEEELNIPMDETAMSMIEKVMD